MAIKFHPHAIERMNERGASKEELVTTIEQGEQFPAKFNRIGFRRNFLFNKKWHEKFYNNKQIEAYCVKENNDWVVITIITRYF